MPGSPQPAHRDPTALCSTHRPPPPRRLAPSAGQAGRGGVHHGAQGRGPAGRRWQQRQAHDHGTQGACRRTGTCRRPKATERGPQAHSHMHKHAAIHPQLATQTRGRGGGGRDSCTTRTHPLRQCVWARTVDGGSKVLFSHLSLLVQPSTAPSTAHARRARGASRKAGPAPPRTQAPAQGRGRAGFSTHRAAGTCTPGPDLDNAATALAHSTTPPTSLQAVSGFIHTQAKENVPCRHAMRMHAGSACSAMGGVGWQRG